MLPHYSCPQPRYWGSGTFEGNLFKSRTVTTLIVFLKFVYPDQSWLDNPPTATRFPLQTIGAGIEKFGTRKVNSGSSGSWHGWSSCCWSGWWCAFAFVVQHVVFQCSICWANSAIPPLRLTTTVSECNSLWAMKLYMYCYLSVYFRQKMSFYSETMMDRSILRHVRLDNSSLMPNMVITKWPENYDVIKLTIAIITLMHEEWHWRYWWR